MELYFILKQTSLDRHKGQEGSRLSLPRPCSKNVGSINLFTAVFSTIHSDLKYLGLNPMGLFYKYRNDVIDVLW